MNGIEKIAARIVSDAQQEAAALKTETEKQAAEVRDAADRQARQMREQLAAEGEAAAEKQYQLLVSSAETEDKKETLRVKQELLTQVFDRAVDCLREMDGGRYVKLLASLAVKASETGREQIILNPRDREACGEAVVAEANRISGKQLSLSEETRPIVGGLILTQGKIEVNCALDTLAALRRNELSSEAAGLLFG